MENGKLFFDATRSNSFRYYAPQMNLCAAVPKNKRDVFRHLFASLVLSGYQDWLLRRLICYA